MRQRVQEYHGVNMTRQHLAIILICISLPLCAEAQLPGTGHGETVSATRQKIAELKLELKRQNTQSRGLCALSLGTVTSKGFQSISRRSIVPMNPIIPGQ